MPLSEETVGGIHLPPTVISTETYGYTDSSWKDLLTSYNGTTITHDAIGNPLSYYNGQSYTFTWERGKQLASAVTGGKTIDFEYNANGIRTEKHVSGTANYYYRLDGDKVVEMVKESELGTQRYVFIYDNEGNPHALYYYSAGSTTPTKYYYVLNMQGDVVQLRNSSYNVVADYTYDAWGKLLSVTNASGTAITSSTHIANVNPIRYRGYFYDTETKLYYCNSRYYDPQIRRFVNADDFDVLHATPGEFTDKNLFAYCDNNPVMREDNGGEFWHVAIGAVIGGVSSFISAKKSGASMSDALISAGYGAVSGGLSAAFPGASAVIDVACAAAESITLDIKNGTNPAETVSNAIISVGFEAIRGSQVSFFSRKTTQQQAKAILKSVPKMFGDVPKYVSEPARKTATQFLKQSGKAWVQEKFQSIAYGALEEGTKWYGARYATWCAYGTYYK